MSTHINATPSEIAQTVLLPGDPLRAKFIAETFLNDIHPYNTVRNMLGFTGIAPGGKMISVQGSGMGMPSLAIYVNELINTYGVKKIIRVGSCGALQKNIECLNIILAMGSCSDSDLNKRRFQNMDFAPLANWELLLTAYQAAQTYGFQVKIGNILATDKFYEDTKPEAWQLFANYGVLAIEMESAELYTLAAHKRIQALSILTVSDHLLTGKHLSADERENTFTDMVKIALKIA